MKKIIHLLFSLCFCLPLVAAAAPSISGVSPTRQVLAPGQNSMLNVTAEGSGPLDYQWIHNGLPVAGATGSSLQLPSASYADAGWYCVDVQDSNGTTRSAPLFLLLAPNVTQVRGWGSGFISSAKPLFARSDVIAVDFGMVGGNLALTRDGSVIGWAAGTINGVPTPSVPDGLADIVAVSAGAMHGLALKADGTVVAWGDDASGQATVPAGLGNVVAITAGDNHSLALRSDGTVVAWGDNSYGQRNLPSGLQNVISITAAETHSVALKADGTVVAWNYSAQGQASPPEDLTEVTVIAAAGRHSAALKSDGTVVGWGNSPGGAPTNMTGARTIAAGPRCILGLKDDGTVGSWGNAIFGEANVPLDLNGVFAIAAGNFYSVALRDGAGDAVPSITVQPENVSVIELQTATFSVTATGAGPFAYQWQKNGQPIAGATESTFTLPEPAIGDAASYTVVVANHIGSVTSQLATLAVTPLPAISQITAPRQIIAPGQPIELSVTATGQGALAYQWYKNSRLLPGATGSNLSIPTSTRADNGYYWVTITDTIGTRRAATIFVNVVPAVTQVITWGENTTGEYAVPGGLNGVVGLAAGGYSLAIKRDGTAVNWGSSYYFSVPAGLNEVVALAVGGQHVLALKSDGTVVAWGGNSYGQATIPPGLKGVVEIAAGLEFSLALKTDGSVVAWGRLPGFGLEPVPAGLSGLEAAQNFAMGVTSGGTVSTWGSFSASAAPIPEGLNNVAKVATSGGDCLALRKDGTVIGWGFSNVPPPAGLTQVVGIIVGQSFSVALKADGSVVKWGGPFSSLLDPPGELAQVIALSTDGRAVAALREVTDGPLAYPVVTSHPQSVLGALGAAHTFTVTASGPGPLGYQWRKNGVVLAGETQPKLTLGLLQSGDAGDYDVVVSNYVGSVTSNAATLSLEPPPVVVSASTHRLVGQPGQSIDFSVAATSANGPLTYRWTFNNRPIPGALASTYSLPAFTNAATGAYTVEIMDTHGLVTRESYFVLPAYGQTEVVAWGGSNNGSQLNVPAGLSTALAISAGSSHSLALLADGTVKGWGGTIPGNSFGQANVPVGLTDVVAISGGGFHSLALKSDGTVVGWGYNINGALDIPAGLSDVIAIVASSAFSMALKSDGTVVTWGSDVPGVVTVPDGLNDVVAISGGHRYALALKADGTVVGWGGGGGNNEVPPGPVSSIAGGSSHALSIKTDGSVAGWGNNINGGTVPPSDLGSVRQVSAGGDFSVALKADGTVVAWGLWFYGQLDVPADLSDVIAISAGGQHTLALRDSGNLRFTQHPQSQQVLAGATATFTAIADGAESLSFQWSKDGVDIPGAVEATYVIGSVQAGDAGAYAVVAADGEESVVSAAAVLTVIPVRPAFFDATGYLAHNGDVAAVIGDVPDKVDRAWLHYYQYGIFEGRNDGDFTVTAYMAQYPGVGFDLQAAALHWYTVGRAQGLRIPAGFSIEGYFARNQDIAAYYANDKYGAWLHYYNYGLFEGRSFDTNFIAGEYLELNLDLKAAGGGDLQGAVLHWLSYGHPIEDRMGRVPIGFNVENYLARYPDLAAAFANVTPVAVRNVAVWHHYIAYGTLEGRSDGDFEAYDYLATNADLAAIFDGDVQTAALHWFFYGRREGRRIPFGFDVVNYRTLYPDLVVFSGDDLYGCWLHYRDTGINEGRIYDNKFRPADYLALNPDIAAAVGNNHRDAFLHWIYYGQYEGRQGKF